MSITSFYFLCALFIFGVLYYLIPKKIQWISLLIMSILYFISTGYPILLIYPFITTGIAYTGAILIDRVKEPKQRKTVLSLVVLFSIGILAILKYTNFFIYTTNALSQRMMSQFGQISAIKFLVPLGLSFYTLSLLGYVIDVYYELEKPEKNPFKILLFGIYFPILNSGPILRYREIKTELFMGHKVSYQAITRGTQRILWGFMKKLVIAERLAIPVNMVFANYNEYSTIILVIAAFCFVLQLYADFSGYMDIVLGISELFGIKMPENFNTPLFSTSVAEFWRRWHMTLGSWLKDYLFYPLLRTSFFSNLPVRLKSRFGKKASKQITVFSAMFLLWFTVGIWHGGAWKYILGSGLIHWMYIVLEEALEPQWKKMRQFLHIQTENRYYILFQRIRTFILFSFAFIFFRAESMTMGFSYYKRMLTSFTLTPMFDGTLLSLGLDIIEISILAVTLLLFYLVSRLQYKGIDARDKIASYPILTRWTLYYGLLFFVILLGYYGPGYSAAEFIYQAF